MCQMMHKGFILLPNGLYCRGRIWDVHCASLQPVAEQLPEHTNLYMKLPHSAAPTPHLMLDWSIFFKSIKRVTLQRQQ